MKYATEETIRRMEKLFEVKGILKEIYIPDGKDEYDAKLKQDYEQFTKAFEELFFREAQRITRTEGRE